MRLLQLGSREMGDISEALKKVVPKRFKNSFDGELLNKINELAEDEETRNAFKENILTFTKVLENKNITAKSYVNACIYIAHKIRYASNVKAYACTFPDRYARYKEKYADDVNGIHKIVNVYDRSRIVQKVKEQSLVPSYIINSDLNAKAIAKMASLMENARSEKVQLDSAVALEQATALPKELRIMQEVKHKADDNIVDVYREALLVASKEKRKMIEEGFDAKEVANISLNKTEIEDAEVDE